jgi:GT2 family glycosyltransferase
MDNNTAKGTQPFISVIILNWNGHEDSIACLESLAKCSYPDFEIILVDNASSDGSISIIKQWIAETNIPGLRRYSLIDDKMISKPTAGEIRMQIIENAENFGFAKGNNIGIEHALKHKADIVLLLNNDTTVQSDFLGELAVFFNTHKDYVAATPQIRYFDKPDVIWNCGGKLNSLGSRKYFFHEQNQSVLPDNEFIDITFITGCALAVRSDIIEKFGMLTEDFFFGEEDYEFSLRMKKQGLKMACVLTSLVYHKLSSSISKASNVSLGKIYIHYLNRFIDLRSYMPRWRWQLWRYSYMVYIFALLSARYKIPFGRFRKFSRALLANSVKLNGVDKQTFDKYIDCDFS